MAKNDSSSDNNNDDLKQLFKSLEKAIIDVKAENKKNLLELEKRLINTWVNEKNALLDDKNQTIHQAEQTKKDLEAARKEADTLQRQNERLYLALEQRDKDIAALSTVADENERLEDEIRKLKANAAVKEHDSITSTVVKQSSVIIGDSNIDLIDPVRIGRSLNQNISKIKAANINSLKTVNINDTPENIIIHTGINDVRNNIKDPDIDSLVSELDKQLRNLENKFSTSNIILSEPMPVSCPDMENRRKKLCRRMNIMLEDHPKIKTLDNSAFLSYRGQLLNDLYRSNETTKIHINENGAALYVSNILRLCNRRNQYRAKGPRRRGNRSRTSQQYPGFYGPPPPHAYYDYDYYYYDYNG